MQDHTRSAQCACLAPGVLVFRDGRGDHELIVVVFVGVIVHPVHMYAHMYHYIVKLLEFSQGRCKDLVDGCGLGRACDHLSSHIKVKLTGGHCAEEKHWVMLSLNLLVGGPVFC